MKYKKNCAGNPHKGSQPAHLAQHAPKPSPAEAPPQMLAKYFPISLTRVNPHDVRHPHLHPQPVHQTRDHPQTERLHFVPHLEESHGHAEPPAVPPHPVFLPQQLPFNQPRKKSSSLLHHFVLVIITCRM